jgi:uncharacterized repeat protein (TIGR03803 family)
MSKLSLWKIICLVCVLCAVETIASPAQTLTTLVTFNGNNGLVPESLVQGRDGNYYGTAQYGGANCSSYGCGGTVFKITPGGKFTLLYSFCSQTNCTDGTYPNGGLVQAMDGNFYGTTASGGRFSSACGYGCGTVFKITPAGTLTTLYSFCIQTGCADGENPRAGLILAMDGNFYGTTSFGGANGSGEVFKITTAGRLTTLYSFGSQTDDGVYPLGLIQAMDGNFYGTTFYGGTTFSGTVFKITPGGTLTTLHSFCGANCADGSSPNAGLVQATNRKFYGTTSQGGSSACSTVYSSGCGTVFEITAGGSFTTLHDFDGTDGFAPMAALVQATNGKLYGTTSNGGANSLDCFGNLGCGTVFNITAGGTLTTIYNFCSEVNCIDGGVPIGGLMQATNGNFYGTTSIGGNLTCNRGYGCGTAFSLSVGLGPFVETLPSSGKVGKAVTILGNNLKGTTSVTFNGTAATFTVVSSTEIKTTVPVGATTGFVKVTTPKKTLKSNVVFRVTK